MRPIGWAIRRRDPTVQTALLRYRLGGWNETAADPLADVEFALDRIRAARPAAPIILVGHSMGGRAAIRSAGADGVCGVVALAPWVPRGEPFDQLAGRDFVVLHGLRDRRTSPEASQRFAHEAEAVARSVRYVGIPGGDHAMLRSARTWHRLIADAVSTMSGQV
jgi:dienelactone hydrolase